MVESCFGGSGEQLLIPGRVLVGEGVLTKMCRKRPKPRQFFLFNDILVYGNIVIGKKKYNKQHIIPLEEVQLQGLDDTPREWLSVHAFLDNHVYVPLDTKNGWLIRTTSKSFAVYAATATEKHEWMAHINKCIEDLLRKSKESVGIDWTIWFNMSHLAGGKKPSETHAAVWVPDNEANICMCCKKTQFTMLIRRHHCRNCGAVVCGPCSPKKFLLPSGPKPQRVCLDCYDSLSATNHNQQVLSLPSWKSFLLTRKLLFSIKWTLRKQRRRIQLMTPAQTILMTRSTMLTKRMMRWENWNTIFFVVSLYSHYKFLFILFYIFPMFLSLNLFPLSTTKTWILLKTFVIVPYVTKKYFINVHINIYRQNG